MSSGINARERLEAHRASRQYLRLFALVDGLVFEKVHGEPMKRQHGCIALFDGTPDAPLAAAGPWLVDAELRPDLGERIQARQGDAPHVSWLLAELTAEGLAQLLQLRLDARAPSGDTVLLRFYDPRVLYGLATTLTPEQREEFFGYIFEWHFDHEGNAMRIGRADA